MEDPVAHDPFDDAAADDPLAGAGLDEMCAVNGDDAYSPASPIPSLVGDGAGDVPLEMERLPAPAPPGDAPRGGEIIPPADAAELLLAGQDAALDYGEALADALDMAVADFESAVVAAECLPAPSLADPLVREPEAVAPEPCAALVPVPSWQSFVQALYRNKK